jgi:predicted patatin/cPLA2 family phospholipase
MGVVYDAIHNAWRLSIHEACIGVTWISRTNFQQLIRCNAWSEEGVMNLAHLFDHERRHRPLDLEAAAFNARRGHIRFVTTDFETGKPLYLNPLPGDWLRILWASATLPLVTRGKIKVDGKWMFDGGISDALP